MGVWEKLGESLGEFNRKLLDSRQKSLERFFNIVKVWVGWDPAILKKIDTEMVTESIKPEMFQTTEFQDLVKDLQVKLAHSPEGLVDWIGATINAGCTVVYKALIGVITPPVPVDFAVAQKQAGKVLAISLDFAVLISIIDVLATALSATLIRNMCHLGQLFISTFGFDRIVSLTLAPALGPGLVVPLQYGYNEKFLTTIPPIQDVIRFTVREVYDPERRLELLSVPTPSEAYKVARKHGFADSVMDDYWAAHWILPSVGELNEMLHRDQIKVEEWRRYMKLHDYEPRMIPNYEKIIYSPYTRVDIRRMYNAGVVDEEGVTRAYKDIGYDDEKSEKLTEFTKSLKTVTTKDLTLSMITKSYKEGNTTYNEALEMIMDLGYEEDEADFILATYEQQGVQESRELSQSKFDSQFQLGLIDRETLKRNLIALGYSAEAAEDLAEIEATKKAAKISLLPLGTLREALRRKILEAADFTERAKRLGYQDDEIEIVLALEEARVAA